MPLHGKDPHELTKLRPKPGSEYFVIRFTNEHFKRYQDYIERLELYLQRIWTCAITGKQGLTYEEALHSEKSASEKSSKISEILIPPIISLIQYKESTLEEITTSTYEYLLTNYFPGEIVVFKAKGVSKAVTGRIIQEITDFEPEKEKSKSKKDKEKGDEEMTDIKSENNSDIEEAEEEPEDEDEESTTKDKKDASDKQEEKTKSNQQIAAAKSLLARKKLLEINKGYKIYVDSLSKNFNVPVKDIMRRDPPVFKPIVKDTIKQMAKRSKHLGGWWEVDEELLKKYTISISPPSHLKREIESMKRKRDDGSDVDFSSSEDESAPKKIKYPIEDLDVDRSSDSPQAVNGDDEDGDAEMQDVNDENIGKGLLTKRPIASSDFFCDSNLYGDFLMVWHFLNQFEAAIQLTPFSLEDLEQALLNNTECELITETHIRLLKVVFTTQAYTTGTPKKSFSGKNLNEKNWYQILIQYFQYETKRIKLEEQRKLEKMKEIEAKNAQMMTLANDIPSGDNDENETISAPTTTTTTTTTSTTSTNTSPRANNGTSNGKEKKEGDEEEEEEDEEEENSDSDYVDESDLEEDELVINSTVPDLILRVIKKKTYYRLSVDEKIHILSYLVLHSYTTDKIRRYVDEINELATGVKAEIRGVLAEERKIKKGEEEEEESNSKKSKQLKSDLNKLQKEEEKLDQKLVRYSTRLESLGKDRDFNKYWYWSQLPGRLYIELASSEWEYYSAKQEIDELMRFLDNRGIRERKLLSSIKSKYESITQAFELKNQQLIQQMTFEKKRSARIKALYGDKPFMLWVNKY